MNENGDFYHPRPPIKSNKYNPRSNRSTTTIKTTDKNSKLSESSNESPLKEESPQLNYKFEPDKIVIRLINGQEVNLINEDQYYEVIKLIDEKKDILNINKYTEIIKYLDNCLDNIIKTNFQNQELELVRLEIGYAQTDYNIFKHKMQGKEADLLETLENHLNDIKNRHKTELENCKCNKEELLEKHRVELEKEETLAENTINDFHKFVESELQPYRARIRQLQIQEEIANDKDKLWKIKNGTTSALSSRNKNPEIMKPSLA